VGIDNWPLITFADALARLAISTPIFTPRHAAIHTKAYIHQGIHTPKHTYTKACVKHREAPEITQHFITLAGLGGDCRTVENIAEDIAEYIAEYIAGNIACIGMTLWA
jgi:hypothetical protein